MKRYFGLVVLLFLVVGLGASSCTKKSQNAKENTLNRYAEAKIKSMDPAITGGDYYAHKESSYIHEGLYEYHLLRRPYELIPALAEGMPVYSKDGKTITIKVKKGVRFQDDPAFKDGKGREVVAEDFIYSWKRIADIKTKSTGWWVFDGKIVGLNEFRKYTTKADQVDYSKPVEGFKALDSHTIQIKLTGRSYQFQYIMASPYMNVVAREAIEKYGDDYSRNPVGTGPFILDRKNSDLGSKMVYLRNPNYRTVLYPTDAKGQEDKAKQNGWLEDAGKQIPFVDKIVTTIYVESQPQWLNFMAGSLDFSTIPKDNYAQAISPSQSLTDELSKKGIKLYTYPRLDLTFTAFNQLDPVLGKHRKLRQAMNLAYNQEEAGELFYNNRIIAAQSPIPPGVGGYDPNYKNPYRQFDLEKAKKLLAEAGFPGGKGLPTFEFSITSSSTARQMGEYFVKSMAKIGIKIELKSYTWPEFTKIVKNRKAQIYGMGWSADYPDAENFLQLLYGKNISPGENGANYVNKEYDALYEKSLTLPDGPERTKIYRKMVDIFARDCPWIVNTHRLSYALIQPWLKNYVPHDLEGSKAKYMRVDTELRAKMLD